MFFDFVLGLKFHALIKKTVIQFFLTLVTLNSGAL